ncbi:hypothetical protein G9A89_014101 [Geosiphon pyriformis]|nr:hypothetical protein G9A89_014101 [Geosiphon pyriformis]
MDFTRKYKQNDNDKLRFRKKIEISTDDSLIKTGFGDIRRAAAFVTYEIEANFGIVVDEMLLSTKTKAKAVLLALEAVSYKYKLTLNTDNQAVNAIKAVIGEKRIDLNINKVDAYTGISENKMADKLAKEATAFDTVEWGLQC